MLLSIVTINYNNLQGLQKTANSIAALWPHAQIEWLVIDGGSTDGAKDFLQNTQPNYWCIEADAGIYDAMNKGLTKASGKYVWFLNSGDQFNTNFNSATLLDTLANDYDLVFSETLLAANNTLLGLRSNLTTRKLPEVVQLNSWLKGMVIGHQAMIVKRAICPKFDLNYTHVADYNWAIELTKKIQTQKRLDTPIAVFDVSGHSAQNQSASNKQRFQVMVQQYGWFKTCLMHVRILWLHLKWKLQTKRKNPVQ